MCSFTNVGTCTIYLEPHDRTHHPQSALVLRLWTAPSPKCRQPLGLSGFILSRTLHTASEARRSASSALLAKTWPGGRCARRPAEGQWFRHPLVGGQLAASGLFRDYDVHWYTPSQILCELSIFSHYVPGVRVPGHMLKSFYKKLANVCPAVAISFASH